MQTPSNIQAQFLEAGEANNEKATTLRNNAPLALDLLTFQNTTCITARVSSSHPDTAKASKLFIHWCMSILACCEIYT